MNVNSFFSNGEPKDRIIKVDLSRLQGRNILPPFGFAPLRQISLSLSRFHISGTLQRIGKNEVPKKPVISSIPVSGAELHVSAMYLEANEKRPATTYWGRPFRQKAVLEL